jgi:signal transduction histidine kinase
VKNRIYLQIYLGVVGITTAILLLVLALGWYVMVHSPRAPEFLELSAEQIAEHVGESSELSEALFELLREHADRVGVWASLWSADGELLSFTGPPEFESRLSQLGPHAPLPHSPRRQPRVPGVTVSLPDGRWLRVHPNPRRMRRLGGPLVALGVLLVAVAGGAYPVSRRIVRRLERLQQGVEQLGGGDLQARVAVEGKDEVAELAQAFNRSADRIQALVASQTRMLGNASHELRTPLARLRVAVELMARDARADLGAEAERDIAELDGLIEDLLLVTRVQSGVSAHAEGVELDAIVATEAERVAAQTQLERVVIHGSARELRRLVRNLLENAARYGGSEGEDSQIAVELSRDDQGVVRLRVSDRGPGVASGERERIFEPFYRPGGHSEGDDGGVGLGLALVREIARHHGGDATCLPREGGGTVFEVELRGLPEASSS